jgi:hypothetical protein
MVKTEWKDILKEFYEESIRDDLSFIRFIGEENNVLQRIREFHQNSLEEESIQIVLLCREVLFENAKFSKKLREGVEDDQRKIRELRQV